MVCTVLLGSGELCDVDVTLAVLQSLAPALSPGECELVMSMGRVTWALGDSTSDLVASLVWSNDPGLGGSEE